MHGRWLAYLNFSVPQVMTATLFFFVIWTATLMLGHFRSASEVGVYAGRSHLAHSRHGRLDRRRKTFAPRISATDAQEDRATLAEMLKRVTHWNTAISLPFFTALALLATPALGIFGSRYTVGAAALSILAVGQLLNTAAGPLGQVINMSGRQYLTMTNNAAVAGLNVLGCRTLIPRYGMTGAACSTAISLTIVNAIKLVQLRLLFKMHPFQRSTLVSSSPSDWPLRSPCRSWFFLLARVPRRSSDRGAVLFAVYAAIAWRFALTDEDRALFAVGRARIKRRLGLRSVPVRG